MLCQQLGALGAEDDDGVFFDYMSLPQHDMEDPDLQRLDRAGNWPAPGAHRAVRTDEEDATFKAGLDSMELLYSMGQTPVIILPVDGHIGTGKQYMARGWCFLELCLAVSFANVINSDLDPTVKLLCERVRDQEAHTVEGFHVAFQYKHFTESGDIDVVLRLFSQTVGKKPKPTLALELLEGAEREVSRTSVSSVGSLTRIMGLRSV